MYPLIQQCPVCNHALHVTKLACSHCATTIENEFHLSKFATLSKEQLQFVEIFLLSRGNIKEVEKALHISYPTVRTRLNEIIEQLSHQSENKQSLRQKEIVDIHEANEITAEEAINLLKNEGD